MDILFVGLNYEREKEAEVLRHCIGGISVASNLYQWNLIDGLIENGVHVDILGSTPTGNFPRLSDKKFFRGYLSQYRGGSTYRHIGFVNFYAIKHWWRKVAYKKYIRAWLKKRADTEAFILFYDLYRPFLDVIKWLQKKGYCTKTCIIVPDLAGKYRNDLGYSNIKKTILRLVNGDVLKDAGRADCFVLLTKQMREIIDTGRKPYVVIDGIVCDEAHWHNADDRLPKGRVILYAGLLSMQYSFQQLISTFESMPQFQKLRLWFCGKGNAVPLIQEAAQRDPRIRYLGMVSKDELKKIEEDVTFYINPRTNNGEYTKYSFPSKNLEYLLAGKPVLAYKLDGMSDDYDDIFLYINETDPNGLKESLLIAAEMEDNAVLALGRRGYEFVLQHNGAKKQALRLIEMMRGAEK